MTELSAQSADEHASSAEARRDAAAAQRPAWHRRVAAGSADLAPGLLACAAVALLAAGIELAQRRFAGAVRIEALLVAILIGSLVRTFWRPAASWHAGIKFSAKTLLEVAVLLLGASISTSAVLAMGPAMLAGIGFLVVAAIAGSYAIGRACGLGHRFAVLIACGNSICGNSAIVALAPVIDAASEDVSASIAFTGVLGMTAVMALPILVGALHMTALQAGAFAGLTVYAVPQVMAATAGSGVAAAQLGMLVKLARVLMLGPVCVVAALTMSRRRLPSLATLVPWFVLGFVALIAARALHLIPAPALPAIRTVSNLLTLVSMAALGLSTDLKALLGAGRRASLTVGLSLLLLGALSLALIRVVGVA